MNVLALIEGRKNSDHEALERDHCRKSFESERRGVHLPAAYRESP